MRTATVALPPKCEAPRLTHAGVERGTTNFINSNVNEDSTAAARLQRLNVLCGVSGRRAELIAFLIWGRRDMVDPQRTIVVKHEAFGVGYDVTVEPPLPGYEFDLECATFKEARTYARGIRLHRGWPIRDLTGEGVE